MSDTTSQRHISNKAVDCIDHERAPDAMSEAARRGDDGAEHPGTAESVVIVTEEMIYAGMDVYMNYEVGGITAGDMVRDLFLAMLSAGGLRLEHASKAPELQPKSQQDSQG
jgi:hypothetical protein